MVASVLTVVVVLGFDHPSTVAGSVRVSPVGQTGILPQIGAPVMGENGLGSAASGVTCPLAASECYYSFNWGGYAVLGATNSVTKVAGSWTVPAVTGASGTTCPDTQKEWLADAQWVGIDGAVSSTVEQTGTESECFYGHTYYYAWYEYYPANTVVAKFTVSAGDQITATVTYKGLNGSGDPTFQSKLTDVTTGKTFTSPVTGVSGALRDSAEWISEAPYYYGILGLTPVSVLKFTGGSATISGVSGVIGSWGSNVVWFVLADYNFPYTPTAKYVKGLPGALNAKGNGFSFTWKASGP